MSSIESPELKTVDTHSQELTIALSTDPVCVAGALVKKKFIQDGVMLEMLTKGDTPTRKATILVEAVRKEIETAPEKLTQFLIFYQSRLVLMLLRVYDPPTEVSFTADCHVVAHYTCSL